MRQEIQDKMPAGHVIKHDNGALILLGVFLVLALFIVLGWASQAYGDYLCIRYGYQESKSIRDVTYCLPYNPSDAIVPLDDLRSSDIRTK